MVDAPDRVHKTHACEVLVIGAGVAGYCAAIQAGRSRCDTILLEKDAVLGGNAGPNLGVGITGAERWNAYGVETGILHELREEGCRVDAFTHTGPGTMGYSISRRFEAVVQTALQEAGVRVLKRHYARRPLVSGPRITGIIAEDLAAFQTVRVDVSSTVIEASGDGEMAALAGADFDRGTEGRDEFNERSAPEHRTTDVQGTSLVAIAHRTGQEVTFIPPPGTPEFTPRAWHGSIASLLHHHGGWLDRPSGIMFLYVTETGGRQDTIRDDGAIYEALLGQLWAEWDHIKNGPHREEARNWDLLWVSPRAGKRESRRFLGDYILTQADLEEGRRFEDDVAYGGHDLDDHRPLGESGNIVALSVPPMYGIPFRCCYSRNVENLLLAGRLISATHLAHSSTRIMGTGAAVGQAVGLAAALCSKHACLPRELGARHMEELQEELLRQDATLLCRPARDPADLARTATVHAASQWRFNDQTPDRRMPLIAPAGVALWDWPARLDRVEMHLRNESGAERELVLTLARTHRRRKWKTIEEYRAVGWDDLNQEAFTVLGRAAAVLPAGFEGWLEFDAGGLELGNKDAATDDDRVLVWLEQAPEVSWSTTREHPETARMVERSHDSLQWRGVGVMGALRLHPAPALGDAANVINGFHRRFSRGPTNQWISRPGDPLPQDLELSWETPMDMSRVCLTFDNLPATSGQCPWHAGRRVLDHCPRAYSVSVLAEEGWREVASVEDNYHRLQVHDFPPVTARRVRLRIISTHGEGQSARVYAVRVY